MSPAPARRWSRACATLALSLGLTSACDLDEVDVKDQDGGAFKAETKGAKKVFTGPDGAQYTIKRNGTIVGPNGEKTKIKRDGTIVQADGTRVNTFQDGTKTKLKVESVSVGKDGTKTLIHDDGSKTVIKADGTVERQFKDGTKTKLQAKSERPVTPDESKVSQEGAG
jgi:hypothetical protein